MKSIRALLPAFCLLLSATAQSFPLAGYADPSFGDDGYRVADFAQSPYASDHLSALAVLPDRRIVAVGTVNVPELWPWAPRRSAGVARFLVDGRPDRSFGDQGRAVFSGSLVADGGEFGAYAMALQSDGKIVIAGTYTGPRAVANDFLILRVLADGSGLDPQFGTNGIVVVPFDLGGEMIDVASAVAIQADGRIVAAGGARAGFGNADMAVVRLLADGRLDRSFDLDGKTTIAFDLGGVDGPVNDTANAVGVQSDGKIVLAGSADTFGGHRDTAVVRLTSSGLPDVGFGFAAGRALFGFVAGQHDAANAVAISEPFGASAADRRIVVAGSTDRSLGGRDFAVALLTDSGQLDSGFAIDGTCIVPFDLSSGSSDGAESVVLETGWKPAGGFVVPYRKIVVGGYAHSQNPLSHGRFALARLLFDGTPDTTFGSGGRSHFSADLDQDGAPNTLGIQAMALQGNRLVIGGTATMKRFGAPADSDFVLSRVDL